MADTSQTTPLRDRLAAALAALETALAATDLSDRELASTLELCSEELSGLGLDMLHVSDQHWVIARGAANPVYSAAEIAMMDAHVESERLR